MTIDRLRMMTEKDLEQVLRWRNHPDIRRFMYTTHEITFDEHSKWFSRANTNSSIDLLIYENESGALGFVNITRTQCAKIADWGFYVAPDAPKGSGRKLGRLALLYAFNNLKLHKLCGQALESNTRSIAFHQALGFKEEGRLREQHYDGSQYIDVVCFGLLIRDWREKIKD